jgi:ABC-type Fe3+-hydroxamate transport system substrate-binding protein
MEPKFQKRRFLYFIWRSPYMLAGHDTYISSVLEFIGWTNAAPKIPPHHQRYPHLSIEDLPLCNSDLILLSTEPYPFRGRDALRLKREWPNLPEIYKIDGKLMSWYGGNSLDLVDQLTAFCMGKPGLISQFRR